MFSIHRVEIQTLKVPACLSTNHFIQFHIAVSHFDINSFNHSLPMHRNILLLNDKSSCSKPNQICCHQEPSSPQNSCQN